MFEFANPLLFLLLPLPLLVQWFAPKTKKNNAITALKVPFFSAITQAVDVQKKEVNRQYYFLLPFLIWILIIIAVAGPRWVGQPQPMTRKGYNIMMALDLSGSMEINDMIYNGRPYQRLDVVKGAAVQFVKKRAGDKIGLILFGSRAYLLSPLTYDKQNILMRVKDATVGLAGKTTSIGDALGLAVKRLQDAPKKGRVVILLTDGANNSGVLQPLKAAELAKDEAIKVYTIGLGSQTDPRAMLDTFMMANATADLDEPTLEQIAEITGGKYFRATDPVSLQKIYQTINQLEPVQQNQPTARPQKDYYPWPLAVAIFLMLGWLYQISGWRFFTMLAVKRRQEV